MPYSVYCLAVSKRTILILYPLALLSFYLVLNIPSIIAYNYFCSPIDGKLLERGGFVLLTVNSPVFRGVPDM